MYYPRQRIFTHLLLCTNRNGHCIPLTIIISQMTSGMRSLTHNQTLPTPSELPDNIRHSLSTCLRKNTVILLKNHRRRTKNSNNGCRGTIPCLCLITTSWRQHVKLKSDINNGYTTGDYRYPKTWQNTLHLLTQYTNPTITRDSESQGKSFAQRTGYGRNPQTYDKAYCKDKEWYNCHKRVIYLIIVQTRRRKSTKMTAIPSTVNKLNPLLKPV